MKNAVMETKATETSSTSLKQDTEKSGLMFDSANDVKPAESIEGETAEMTDGESGSILSHKRRQRRDEPDDDELTEESENADTLKFEHTDRSFEKQSHFADMKQIKMTQSRSPALSGVSACCGIDRNRRFVRDHISMKPRSC